MLFQGSVFASHITKSEIIRLLPLVCINVGDPDPMFLGLPDPLVSGKDPDPDPCGAD
jgi:hypothetical protein